MGSRIVGNFLRQSWGVAEMTNWHLGEGLQPKPFFQHRSFSCGARVFQYETAKATSSSANTQLHSSQSRMEKTVNQVTLMGRVGGDPQKRGTQEHPVVVFSMATHSNYNQVGGILQKTDWHRICVFKPYLRDTVYKYMSKGQRVYITGRISYGEIKDENGNSHTTTSVIADDVIFISNSAKSSIEVDEVD